MKPREPGQAAGLTGNLTVVHQLMALECKGFAHRDPHRRRAYEVRGSDQHVTVQPTDVAGMPAATYVPLAGRITTAGGPLPTRRTLYGPPQTFRSLRATEVAEPSSNARH